MEAGSSPAIGRLVTYVAPKGSSRDRDGAAGVGIRVQPGYLFDRDRGRKVEDWAESFRDLNRNQLLWVDLVAPSSEEESQAREVFGLGTGPSFASSDRRPNFEQQSEYLVVTAIAVADEELDIDHERVVVHCFVGQNWLLTVHDADISVIDDFQELASGEGEIGALDAPSFLSALLEWIVASYMRALDEIEEKLERFDVETLSAPGRHPDKHIKMLIEARQRIGRLRRSLAPHREIFAALSHSEFDPLSSEESSERFVELTARLEFALASARDVKDAITNSFDVLIVRTEHRTNEIVKVLTLVSILLLPGALIAGILGMNINFSLAAFATSSVFWLGITTFTLIALAALLLVRRRHWI